jgi:hypothetical protein
METRMTEIEDLAARLLAVETVVRQLLTHLAVRTDDPPQWVATRRTLALHAMHREPVFVSDPDARAWIENAIDGFFGQVQAVVEAYGGTPGGAMR